MYIALNYISLYYLFFILWYGLIARWEEKAMMTRIVEASKMDKRKERPRKMCLEKLGKQEIIREGNGRTRKT